ncbi:hypothetical protein HUU05_13035 [candidate division KSB1 bacterium]|nr:hypothetical protein [candidate division KSB1 bacterium]
MTAVFALGLGLLVWPAGLSAQPSPTARPPQPPAKKAVGPLRVHPNNPRYFTDGTKNLDGSLKAVYLTGSHTWNNLQDMGPGDPPPAFDYDAYLDFLERHGHNFVRMWRRESVAWGSKGSADFTAPGVHMAAPHPWARTGPGLAQDGKPKFDLEKFDEKYFQRLRGRVQSAGERGIYVAVMLFEGDLPHKPGRSRAHPFHIDNNINGISGDPNDDGSIKETHTLENPAITRIQEAYVRKVIDTVGDLDSVLFEIANECGRYSTDWQYHLIRFIKAYEQQQPQQHPVGMTFQYYGSTKEKGTNQLLFDSPADWISPNTGKAEGLDYLRNPPPSDGKKVILLDTDHLGGITGNSAWVWRSFLRGHNPIFMDPYDNLVLGTSDPQGWEPLRASLGHTRRYAERMNLATMTPRNDLASTQYCLANPGSEYLVYQPDQRAFTVDLTKATGDFDVEWFDPQTGKMTPAETVQGGAIREFAQPIAVPVVLYLRAKTKS